MSMRPTGRLPGLTAGLVLAGLVSTALVADAQPATLAVRLAQLSQWTVNQHRGGSGPVVRELGPALDAGVVDRVVFWWQRGSIQRSSLAWKPVRVLPADQAGPLGGRGEFELVAVRAPAGPAAWTEVQVRARTGQPGDVLVLEVGGELNTITQVLETVFLVPAAGSAEELRLGREAAGGVPVKRLAFGRPPGAAVPFGGRGDVELFVARSPVEALPNGSTTTTGPADVATTHGGDWREADRVYIRLPLGGLQAGLPGIVLGWKDRTLKPDPDGGLMEQRRSQLPGPVVR
jgi:hypothetical protein